MIAPQLRSTRSSPRRINRSAKQASTERNTASFRLTPDDLGQTCDGVRLKLWVDGVHIARTTLEQIKLTLIVVEQIFVACAEGCRQEYRERL
jgi:hypothetical protein